MSTHDGPPPPTGHPVPGPTGIPAAFFDLDKTVIAKAALLAFSPTFRRAGILSWWLVLRALWGQVVFRHLGADEARMAKLRQSALRIAAGWEQQHVRRLVVEALEQVVDPIVYHEALDLITDHHEQGHRVYVISASPEEIVVPLAGYLGVDEALATRAELDDDGRYTGAVEFYCQGPGKAEAIRSIAERDGLDLSASYAYSDSITDLPMLESVGHPVVVNPDRELARQAIAREWPVRHFEHGVSIRNRIAATSTTQRAAAGGTAAGLAAAGTAAWILLRRRSGVRSV
jgi:HAD superfamily hydrolase (TIGR01490 family)